MARFEVFVAGDPKAKGSKRAFVVKGRAVLVEGNKDTRSWERLLAEAINLDTPLAAPLEGSVRVALVFSLRRPKSAKKRLYPMVRPDIDKLCRTVLDALVRANTLTDDAQVVHLKALKVYAEEGKPPGVQIDVGTL